MGRYVAFLRGINVGGNTMVSMSKLKIVFEGSGFKNVRTILNSGNVLFEAAEKDKETVKSKIESAIEKKLGLKISVSVRTSDEIAALINSDPFKGVKVTPDTRLYLTFLQKVQKPGIKMPYLSPEKDFKLIKIQNGVLVSYIVISPKRNTTDLMKIIDREFGKEVTTRNIETVNKVAEAFGGE